MERSNRLEDEPFAQVYVKLRLAGISQTVPTLIPAIPWLVQESKAG